MVVTGTVAASVAECVVAVIVAVPLATAVTRPADDAVATDEFDVAQVTVARDIVIPLWSLTVAVCRDAAPSDVSNTHVEDSSIEVAV